MNSVSSYSDYLRLFTILIPGLLVLMPHTGLAEQVWRCGDNTYTSQTEAGKNCQLLRSSVICGSEGNKYISPHSNKFSSADEKCPESSFSRSPFINYELLDDTQNRSGWALERGTFTKSRSHSGLNQINHWLEYAAATFRHIGSVLATEESE